MNFWQNHGIFFLVFITLFPRLTLLFSSVATGGLLWWLGFFFTPRLLVAVLATLAYSQTNPILVIISWFVAIRGELMEKKFVRKKVYVNPQGAYSAASWGGFRRKPINNKSENVIDAEFKRL